MMYAIEFFSHSAIEDISIKPEAIFHVGSFAVTNSLFTTWIVMALIIIVVLVLKSRLKVVPSRFQSIFEMMIEGTEKLLTDITNDKEKSRKMFPLVLTIFMFVLVSNFAGLLPGAGSSIMVPESHIASANHDETMGAGHEGVSDEDHNSVANSEEADSEEAVEGFHYNGMKYVPLFRAPSSDLNMTFALAIITMIIVQIVGIATLKLKYFSKFLYFSSIMNFMVGILELVAEFAKVLAFSFRLFGNIFAGEVLLVVMGSFLAIILPMPFYGFEIFVAIIQAFVFAILSAAFLNLAMEYHES